MKQQHRQHGFTIVELLVSMAVFSVVLMVVTIGIVQVSRVYYKGVTEANTQNVARNIMDTVAQAIQFSGGSVLATNPTPTPGTSYAFCINNQEFSYRLGFKMVDGTLGANQTNHALVQRTVSGCDATGQDLSGSISGRELLAPNMRLANLVVEPAGDNLYRVQVRVVYGDDDLLYSPTGLQPATNGATAKDASCRGEQGRQFCAVSELSTVVISRVQ
jgi:prepilin-type N-terminal cleavage/methylation domain-containing protein